METYQQLLQDGAEYSDLVQWNLSRLGISVGMYGSRKWQYNEGESSSGIEVKHDRKFTKTGNLYIEVKERTSSSGEWHDSGIFRQDNTWLWAIGDESRLFIFSKLQLQRWFKSTKRSCEVTTTATSQGVLMNAHDRDLLCIREIRLEAPPWMTRVKVEQVPELTF